MMCRSVAKWPSYLQPQASSVAWGQEGQWIYDLGYRVEVFGFKGYCLVTQLIFSVDKHLDHCGLPPNGDDYEKETTRI